MEQNYILYGTGLSVLGRGWRIMFQVELIVIIQTNWIIKTIQEYKYSFIL